MAFAWRPDDRDDRYAADEGKLEGVTAGGGCVASPAPPPTPSPTAAAAAEGGALPVATVRAAPVACVFAASAVASSLLPYQSSSSSSHALCDIL
ncbi:unnamed protein product [Closterium sp. NIES-53]